MVVTSDTVRQVLRSWLAIEVLTPEVTKDSWSGLAADKEGQQRNKRTAAANDPANWEIPGDEDTTPWPLLAERPEVDESQGGPAVDKPEPDPNQPRPWYSMRWSPKFGQRLKLGLLLTRTDLNDGQTEALFCGFQGEGCS